MGNFRELYEFVQTLEPKISRSALLPQVKEICRVSRIHHMQRTLNTEIIRGFIVFPGEGAHPLAQWARQGPLIVLSRDLNYCWERFVFVKELMHLFDEPLERVSSGDEFEALLAEFPVPLPERSAAMLSEINCLWMALAALCPEEHRQQLSREHSAGRLTSRDVADRLKIPEQYVPHLFSSRYKQTITRLIET